MDNRQWFKDADIAAREFGWKTVKRDGKMVLVNPAGQYEPPPPFSALAKKHERRSVVYGQRTYW